jgi:hypothetical protein
MSLFIPEIPDKKNSYMTDSLNLSKITSTVIRQFASSVYIVEEFNFPDKIICLN